MNKKSRNLPLIIVSFLLILFSGQLFATRYDIIPINEPELTAINNKGTLVGVDTNGEPFVWKYDEEEKIYPEETDVNRLDRVYKIFLPIDELITNTFIPSEIHVVGINNELEEGSGASIIGWYFDENDQKQSLLWYLEENETDDLVYKLLVLAPHKLSAPYCTGNAEIDFDQPHCMLPKDSGFIYRALLCSNNENWDGTSPIFYNDSFLFPSDDDENVIIPTEREVCSSSVPICEFKTAKIPDPDGPKIVTNENGEEEEVPAFIYRNNPMYNTNTCVLKEHVDYIVQAMQCDNTEFTEPGQPITIQCDDSSQTVAINNESMIVGVSFKADGSNRPVVWSKAEGKTEEGKPKYGNGDLGTNRVFTENPTIVEENSEFINNIKLEFVEAEVTIDDVIIDVDEITISNNVTTTLRNGYPTFIDKSVNSAVGLLQLDGADLDASLTPVFWSSITATGIEPPEALLQPDPSTRFNDACKQSSNPPLENTSVNIIPTSIASGLIIGWYDDVNGNSKPIMWTSCPNELGEVEITPGHLPSFDSRNVGKALDISGAGETIGTTLVDVTDATTGEIITESHAFYRTTRCGIQDLNELLASPDSSILLESADKIATGAPPTPLITRGKIKETGETFSYILTPTEVLVDLEARVSSNHSSLTVGDEHAITVTIINNGAVDNESVSNYATCVFFKLTATVYTTDTYEDKVKEARDNNITITEEMEQEFERFPKIGDELVGGLTISENYESAQDIFCVVNRIEIVCAIERLDVGETASLTVQTVPRPLLADRTIRTTASVFATEEEALETRYNNIDFELIKVEREACFIATAAYGSYLAPEVAMLRSFRDDILLQSVIGESLVNIYYDTSPPLAKIIQENETLKRISRYLLTPMVYTIKYPILLIGYLFILIFVFYQLRKRIITFR